MTKVYWGTEVSSKSKFETVIGALFAARRGERRGNTCCLGTVTSPINIERERKNGIKYFRVRFYPKIPHHEKKRKTVIDI